MDRETVITHLQIIYTWAEFARERDLQFFTAKHLEHIAQWSADALAMLKEQQQRIEALEIDIDILAKDINTKNCNTCKMECEHRPRLGETVRANCFMWEGT